MWYQILETIHILMAIGGVGTSMTYPFLHAWGESAPEHLTFTLLTIRRLDRRVANPCYIGVLLSGTAMVLLAGYSFMTIWILYALSAFATIVLLGILVYKPVFSALIEHSAKGPGDERYRKYRRKSRLLNAAILLLLGSVLVMMIWKPT